MAEHHHETAEELGHEPISVSARAVSLAVTVLFGVILLSLLLIAGLMVYLAGRWGGAATVGPAGMPIAPPPGVAPLDADQETTLQQLKALENRVLTQYFWVDQEAGIARIPIERAMEILAEQGSSTTESSNDESDSEAR